MSYINFIISRINYLPYYVPLVIEAKNRNIKSNFFLSGSDKPFISPYTESHLNEIKKLADKYNIMVYDVSKLIDFPAITFFCEGDIVGRKNKKNPSPNFKFMTSKHLKVSIICNYEYVMFYNDYINNVDHVILLHQFWADYYLLKSPKNLFLGSPKYDSKYYKLDKTTEEYQNYLSGKYKLDLGQKYVLIIFPKDPIRHHKKNTLYPSVDFLLQLYDVLRKLGYKVIVKTRKQDKIKDKKLRGDYYFEDIDFYPCNSMELITISNYVILFSSSINEECVALKTPYIDIKVDMTKDRFGLLNDNSYGICLDIGLFYRAGVDKLIPRFIDYLDKIHYQPDNVDSDSIFKNYYTDNNKAGGSGSSKRIINWVETKYGITNKVNNSNNKSLDK